MKPFMQCLVALALLTCFAATGLHSQTTVEQKLLVVQNDATPGGNFRINIQVKCTNPPLANTLARMRIEVFFDNTELTFVDATNWFFGAPQGYVTSAINNATSVQISAIGDFVNNDGGGTPAGIDVGPSYVTWLRLNFTIVDGDGTTNLTIGSGNNLVAFFDNHSNDPKTDAMINQTLSPPENIINVQLPVQLVAFSAAPSGLENAVELSWSTLSEINNYGFFVQRRAEAEGEFSDLTDAFVEGHGTTAEPRSYSYTDHTATSGEWVYRLRQQDLDGTSRFSEEARVSLLTSVADAVPAAFTLSQNYPNPFNPSTDISFSVERTGEAAIVVYNTMGQEVARLFEDQAEPGRLYHVRFDGSRLASGLYLYRLISNGQTAVRRMMLVR